MARPSPQSVRHALRRVTDSGADELPDGELLRRFVAERDADAFRTLLHRHGPMVLGVCRALLRGAADAEDAFQATFLVFARRAASIRATASLSSWLHGVAYRTARKAQAEYARRQKHEPRAAQSEAIPPDDLSWREVQQVLHEELNSLSERHRAPLALCYLQGKTLDEAAAQLGLAKNTLKTRLERGRAVLRARLVRRGLAPAVLLASAWPGVATALPAELLESTIKTATSAPVSANVVTLTEGVLSAMRITKLKLATAVFAVFAAVGLSLGGLAHTSTDMGGEEKGKSALATGQDGQKPEGPKVIRDKLKDRHGEDWVRVTGKVQVIDAKTLEFDDGTRIELWYVAPRLNQMAMNGEKLYPAGKEAAEFLRKCIGDKPVTCLHQAERNQYAVTAYVGDTSLNELMVVNGWAFAVKMPLPSEFTARENKRGLWGGKFTDPTDWEAGVRLPGEPPPPKIADEREAHRLLKTYHERKAAMPTLLDRIVKDVPDVRVLDLNGAGLSNDTLAKLAGLKSLEELSLGRNITDDGLRHLKSLTSLKRLDLQYATVSDAGLEHVGALISLESLALQECKTEKLTAEGLNRLKGLKKLRRLTLYDLPVTDAFLEHVGTLTDLEVLELTWTQVTDEGLKHLKGLQKLRFLVLHHTRVTDAGLAHLSGLKELRVLGIGATRITNAGLPHLKGLANLVYLDLGQTEVTDAGHRLL